MPPSPMRPVVAAALVACAAQACVYTDVRGPDLGACADLPDGAYTYGEAGIGTCLSGPTDVQFHQDPLTGQLLLAVTNADPFRTFASGSWLDLPAEQVRTAAGTTTIDGLDGVGLPLERFAGRFGLAQGGQLAIVPSRMSDGSYFRGDDDRVWYLDLSDASHPAYADRPFATVGADPGKVLVDDRTGRAYVLNATGASISVLDTTVRPPSLLDPAPASVITTPRFTPVAGSIGRADLIAEVIEGTDITRTDRWTATWVEGTWRIWVPTGPGLARWSSGGQDYRASAFGVELDPSLTDAITETRDPFIGIEDGALVAWFGDAGVIRSAFGDGTLGTWFLDPTIILAGDQDWDAYVGGPSLVAIENRQTMYFDGRTADGEPASIGQATSSDGLLFRARSAPVLGPPDGYDSIEQPSVLVDDRTGTVRMWATLRQGDRWSIGSARSSDAGLTWEEAEPVFAPTDADVGAPYVVYTGGRYLMWLAVRPLGGVWSHATSWSWDGLTWTTPEVIVASDRDPSEPPPRLGVQPAPYEAWRVEGDDAGIVTTELTSGTGFLTTSRGFSLSAATGHLVGTDVGPNLQGGLFPTSVAAPNGVTTVYATGRDPDGIARLLALRQLGDRWVIAADDLVPAGAGGNVDGASDPLVYEQDGQWHLIYAGAAGEIRTLAHAVSDDGLHFTPAPITVTGDTAPWESVERRPHSLVRTDEGYTLWYSGFDGNRYRIGALVSTDGTTWSPSTGSESLVVLNLGSPGTFDDVSVRDPMVIRDGDTETMWYAGNDGAAWSIGVATRTAGGTWVRHRAPYDGNIAPVLQGVEQTFSTGGTLSPVAVPDGDGFTLWYAGTDGAVLRIGTARATLAGVGGHDHTEAFAEQHFLRAGDTLTFDTRRGEPGRSAIALGQIVERVVLPGTPGTSFRDGPTSMVYDEARGFLYVGSKDYNGLIVVDVRDDSTATFDDRNYLDIEAVLRFETTTGVLAVHDLVQADDGLLYLAVREPDGVLVVDPTGVVDDDVKEVLDHTVRGVLPVHDLTDDDGDETFAALGVAGIALVPGRDLLITTHFRDNSISVFDLTLGAVGEEIAHLEDVGEQPHLVRVAPDGTWAVVATYLGSTTDSADGSSLLVLDLDPASPTYLQVRARIVNR
ncbi:MAG: hypothetical protein H6733_08510 [Alphaproteobacteria bacterium]|nr:hypothetical protein [Alphaproteobacteria bacterium]